MAVPSPILIVAADFVRTGGMDRANLALAEYAAASGAEVHLVAHRVANELTCRSNVRFHPVPKPANSYFLGGPLLARTGRQWAARIAGQGGRVVVNGGNCRWGDVNWVHYVHVAYQPEVAGNVLRHARWRWNHQTYVRQEREALRAARVVITNSQRTRRDVIERIGVPAERVHCVYLGIDPQAFAPPGPGGRRAAKAALGWDTRPVVAFIGGLGDRRKGFDTLYAAWQTLAADRTWEADLAVIGSGAEMPEWKARAETVGLGQRIRFLGFRRDVPAVLAACDALVAPTRYEPYGMAVSEALAMGTPALVSRSAGIAEWYPPEMNGLLIESPGDASELVDRLRDWQASSARWETLTLELSKRLRAHTWEEMGRQFFSVIDSGANAGQ